MNYKSVIRDRIGQEKREKEMGGKGMRKRNGKDGISSRLFRGLTHNIRGIKKLFQP